MSRATWIPVPHTAWSIHDPFWTPRRDRLFTTTLVSQHDQLRESGRLSRLGIQPSDPARASSHVFYDSDIAKWLEAVAYAEAERPHPGLRAASEAVIAGYERIQMPDGYLNSHFAAIPERRWTNLPFDHELYCLGHLIEAALAWHRHLGCDRLLTCCRRAIDHVWQRFGPAGVPVFCGHPEIELALMRYARWTGEAQARILCRLFIERRGRNSSGGGRYIQDTRPLVEEFEAVGHTVRCLYLACGALDLAHDEDDTALAAAIERIWSNAISRRMHITGGMGSSPHDEGFTADWDLDPFRAYNETCAGIALMMLAQRLLAVGPRVDAGDILELALHNTVLAGWSLDGERYLYANPLAVDLGWDGQAKRWNSKDWGRERWFGCACCPPNVARTMASLGSYAAATSEGDLALHLFLAGTLDTGAWRLRIEGDWVRTGRIAITVETAPAQGILHLRAPGWSADTRLLRDGVTSTAATAGYLHLAGLRAGTRLDLSADVAPRRIRADPRAGALAGRVALAAGPLIYCLESCDHQHVLDASILPWNGHLAFTEPDPALANCRPIVASGQVTLGEGGTLYRSTVPHLAQAELRAVPYALWNHRESGAMRVWLREG